MLTINGSIKVKQSIVEVDEYVPLSFRCLEVFSTPSIWYRLSSSDSAFIEIGIAKSTGAIFDVTAVLLPNIHSVNDVRCPDDAVIVLEELPTCRLPAGSAATDEVEDVELDQLITCDFVDNCRSLFIWFGTICRPDLYYKVDRISFGVNSQGELAVLKISPLNDDEYYKLAERPASMNTERRTYG